MNLCDLWVYGVDVVGEFLQVRPESGTERRSVASQRDTRRTAWRHYT